MSSTSAPASSTMSSLATVWAPRVLSIVRIMVALQLIEHGTQKLFSFPAPPSVQTPAAFTLIWFAAVLEIGGGSLLLFGLFTRLVAFVLCGEMAAAYFLAHAPRSFFPLLNGGDAAILFCFAFLYMAVAGGGAWSLDRGRGAS